MRPVLVVISGLPATGKSTIAGAWASRARTPYLRVDRIEQAVVAWTTLTHPVGAVGYAVAHQLAVEQLGLGLDVVVECVNPTALTRDAWVQTAAGTGAALVDVEVVCSDAAEHRRRVQTRASDVDGLVKPTWSQVTGRPYEDWSRPVTRIDTAVVGVDEAVRMITAEVAVARGPALS